MRIRTAPAGLWWLALAVAAGPVAAGDPPAVAPAAAAAAKQEAALELIERHAVLVALRFQKDIRGEEEGAVPPDEDSTSEAFRRWRMSLVVPGFVVRDRRTVLISDLFLPPGAVASVEVRPLAGAAVPARLRGFLRRAEGAVVETASDLPVEPLAFEALGPSRDGLLAGSVAEGSHGLESWVDGLGTAKRHVGRPGLSFGAPDSPTAGLTPEEGARTVDLLVGPGPKALGLRFGSGLDLDHGVWRGADVLAEPEVAFESLAGRAREWAARPQRARIEVVLRTTKRDDLDDSADDDGEDRLEHWGFAVAPDLLVMVGRLEPDQVRRLETLRHKVDDGPGRPASYAGKLRGLDGYLVRVPGAEFEPLVAPECPLPAIGEALLVHTTGWRGGARRDQVDYNRMLGMGRRYGDKLHLAVERAVTEGALLLDVEGRPLGVAVRLDPEEKESALEAMARGRRERSRWPLMAVLFREVGGTAALANDPDTSVMPQEEVESKRLPWLGVEGTGIDKGVAEVLDISAPTRDGQRGLLVGRVYKGSPAARAGIAEGDILLTARLMSGPGSDAPPVDLSEQRERRRWSSWDFGGEDEAAPAPWRAQDTALHRLLKRWGPGAAFEIQFLRGKELKTAALKVEIAPPSLESAPRARDEATGLTVRDLTYEVRAALRLADDAPGVVVARIEPGSPAAQARIAKNEVLQEVDGTPVVDAASLVALLEAARAKGQESVRCVVRRLDKTRLVELQLGA